MRRKRRAYQCDEMEVVSPRIGDTDTQSRRIYCVIIPRKNILIDVASLQKLLETDCSGLQEYGEGSVAD
jgi:hypothetical protein